MCILQIALKLMSFVRVTRAICLVIKKSFGG